ncbi:MAG: hypothetical protein PUG74_00225 [Prevotellaceae bacterium]|nr:hypothetical protein [Prevotellaceae bacterium]
MTENNIINPEVEEENEAVEPKVIDTIQADSPENLDKIFSYITMVRFEDYALFDSFELYNFETEESVQFNSAKEAMDYVLNGKTVGEHIKDFKLILTE